MVRIVNTDGVETTIKIEEQQLVISRYDYQDFYGEFEALLDKYRL